MAQHNIFGEAVAFELALQLGGDVGVGMAIADERGKSVRIVCCFGHTRYRHRTPHLAIRQDKVTRY
jgi:hypothetical protein